MIERLATVWETVRTSLWFVPAVMGVAGLIAALAASGVTIDGDLARTLPDAFGAERARDLLSTLLASLITMVTLALSITMVVLSLAANALGPRLLPTFMGDWRTQIVLGVFTASIVFLILTIVLLADGERAATRREVAVATGTGLSILCLFLLMAFVHHLGRSIAADSVIERVAREFDRTLAEAVIARSDAGAAAEAADPGEDGERAAEGAVAIRAANGGYVQAIAPRPLVRLAVETGTVIRLAVRPGHHVVAGETLGWLLGGTPGDDAARRAARAIRMGETRIASFDIEFALRQLVEIALRALSPGINDPFTAIAVIDRTGQALGPAVTCPLADGRFRDGEGRLRLVHPVPTIRGLLDTAFNQIRQAASGKPDVLMRILESLDGLAGCGPTPAAAHAIRAHARLVLAAALRSVDEAHDREAVEARFRKVTMRLLPDSDAAC